MTAKTLFVASAALLLTACNASNGAGQPAQDAQNAPRPEPRIVGGWGAGEISAEARAAAQYAVTAMNRPGVTLTSLDAVEQQVVAGINYRLDLTLSDGSRVRATVWKKLDGSFELTNVSPIG